MGDFCIALYNPSSKGRPDYLARAVRILLANGKAPGTVCGIVRNIGREGQESRVLTLAALETTRWICLPPCLSATPRPAS